MVPRARPEAVELVNEGDELAGAARETGSIPVGGEILRQAPEYLERRTHGETNGATASRTAAAAFRPCRNGPASSPGGSVAQAPRPAGPFIGSGCHAAPQNASPSSKSIV